MGLLGPFEGVSLVEFCLHLANILYLLSFLGRDMLCLRVLTCAGLTLGIVFFSCQPTPLYGPTAWHVIFLTINSVQIRRLILERRERKLTEEQARVAAAAFQGLSHDELVNLLTHVMYRGPARLRDLVQVFHEQLTPEERALRDIAFSRLSRDEITNLLTRQLWNFLTRLNPAWWRRRRRPHVPIAIEPEGNTLSGSAAG